VEIKGSDIYVDFTGTDEQAQGFINSAPFLTISQAWMALMFWVDPAIPKNQGLYRPFKKIYAPKGTILNPNFPAPVGGCTCDSGGLVLDIMLGAFTKALSERGLACWTHAAVAPHFYGTNPETGEFFILGVLDGLATGGGARYNTDGWPIARVTSSTIGIPNVEIVEQHNPIRYIKREMITDAGGDGKFRGGPGLEIEYEVLVPMELTAMGLRRRHPCPGANGGTAGGSHHLFVISEGKKREIPQKAMAVKLKKGDRLILTTPGGGGYGKPEDRDPEMVRNDVRDGYLSLEKARKVYGFEELS
jgi:N-methylhydantoinase B/oxoprolinase/acetone carboxylase alpha subunit